MNFIAGSEVYQVTEQLHKQNDKSVDRTDMESSTSYFATLSLSSSFLPKTINLIITCTKVISARAKNKVCQPNENT